jgi:hypothetical protein
MPSIEVTHAYIREMSTLVATQTIIDTKGVSSPHIVGTQTIERPYRVSSVVRFHAPLAPAPPIL